MPCDGVAFHAALVVTAHQTIDIELHEEAPATGAPGFLRIGEKSAIDGLFNANQPWSDGVNGEGNALMLDVAEGGVLQIAHQVRRHTINPADLRDLKLARFKELRFVVGHGDRRERHGLFKYGHFAGVGGAAIGCVPALPQAFRVFDRIGMRKHAGGSGTILEELAAVLLGGDAKANGVLFKRYRAVSDNAIKAQAGNVQHILRLELDGLAFRGGVGVCENPFTVPVHRHVIRQERIQPDDAVAPGTDDLAVAVAPQKQVGEHGFPPDEGGHFGVGFIMEQSLNRVFRGLGAAVVGVFVHVELLAGDGFCDDADAVIDRGQLHSGLCGDRLARTAGAKIKGGRSTDGVLRLVTGTEPAGKRVFHGSFPFSL